MLFSLTIYLTLVCQNVESDPGPHKAETPTLSILTYNCNGLGDLKKRKRLLLKINVLVKKGCIIFLQEMHIVDTKSPEMIWKYGFLSNCVKTNSARVIILYNKQCDLVHKYADFEGYCRDGFLSNCVKTNSAGVIILYNKYPDFEGRQLIAVIGNDERKFIVVNAYFPNDHKQGQMYSKVLEVKAEYNNHITFCGRDMNVCLSSNDSLNRIDL